MQSKLLKTGSFIIVETIYIPLEHTHYILLAALIFLRCGVGKNVFVFLYSHVAKFIVRLVSPHFRNEADWLKMLHATDLSYFVGKPTFIL